ncbi:TauD/TfdA family dioxygenase [Streptomyces sp. NPDC002055]|uniref:TauD/TfdA family dioxygenase n=1 Tax=Streptomyces sp. NPDC002055 TaxID=3154534 RepID=UPI00332F7DE2
MAPRPVGLELTEAFTAELHSRIAGNPGFAVITGFPVDATDPRETEMAYWFLGLLLGRPVSQSAKGDLLGRVEDRGADIASPVQRGYESSAELPFHVDRTDVIGLLCVRPAASGGLSRLVSSRTVHDLLLAERPELLAELRRPYPNDRRGEEQPGQPPWSGIPVFSQVDGSFATRYVRRFIEGSQRHPDAPRLTGRQTAAMDAVDEILRRPGVSLDMELRRGDLQLINNFHILHARTAFADGGGRGRLLLRLWLAFAGSPALPGHYTSLYGATAGGSYRGGVWPTGATPAEFGRPVAELG